MASRGRIDFRVEVSASADVLSLFSLMKMDSADERSTLVVITDTRAFTPVCDVFFFDTRNPLSDGNFRRKTVLSIGVHKSFRSRRVLPSIFSNFPEKIAEILRSIENLILLNKRQSLARICH